MAGTSLLLSPLIQGDSRGTCPGHIVTAWSWDLDPESTFQPCAQLPPNSVHACSVAQLCPILCDPLDYSLPGSSIYGIFQAGIQGWVAISSSRGSSRPRDRICISYITHIADRFFTAEPMGKALSQEQVA